MSKMLLGLADRRSTLTRKDEIRELTVKTQAMLQSGVVLHKMLLEAKTTAAAAQALGTDATSARPDRTDPLRLRDRLFLDRSRLAYASVTFPDEACQSSCGDPGRTERQCKSLKPT